MAKTGPKPKSIEEKWQWALKWATREGDCILVDWGCPVGIGYRTLYVAGQYWYAHHLADFIHRGEAPPGTVRRHTCDRPNCINIEHILRGTHNDNVQDKVSKRRHNHGVTCWNSVLTAKDVLEILNSPLTVTELGHMYGISRGGAHNIKTGRTWNHITGLPKIK